MHEADLPPVLLLDGGYYGTLAAVRCFGRLGVPVTIAETKILAPAKWSRYVSRRVNAPSLQEPGALLSWLCEFGRQNPNYVLYPTSDEMAWFMAFHRDVLSSYYKLYVPSVECMYQILNKKLLHALCRELQIATPETWVPGDEADLDNLSGSIPYPVMLKPQTQIFFQTYTKGGLVQTQAELLNAYRSFAKENTYAPTIIAFDPDVLRPMLQRYYPEAADSIYNLSGFIDETGDLVALRASRKILQIPRQLGTGVCFEEAAVEPLLGENLIALCQRLGYYGVFEVEFIQTREDGQYLLTDFNPRFYKQMAFDVTRGLPLPAFVYYAAAGNYEQLRTMVQAAQTETSPVPQVFCHKFEFSLMLNTQKIARATSAAELRQWKDWFATHRRGMTDAVADPADRLPALVDFLLHMLRICRHPKGFVLRTVLNR